jgi:hypothetical protein
VGIAEGAHFRGSIDMQRAGAKPGEQKAADGKPATASATSAAPSQQQQQQQQQQQTPAPNQQTPAGVTR